MANKTELIGFEIGDKIAEEHGYYLVDVQFQKEAGKQYLRLFIDKDGGVGIDDCEVFSRAFEVAIDEADAIDAEYVLEVSSPGVERKLRTEREFMHYIGREVDVKLFKAENGRKEFSGVLKEYADGIAVVTAEEDIKINTKDAAYIKLHFEF